MDMMAIRRSVVMNQTALVSKSGNPVSFRSAIASLPECIVNIEPNQNLNGQANPYPAGGGKNLWSYDASFSKDDQTLYTTVYISLPAGTYTVSGLFTVGDTNNNLIRFSFRDNSSAINTVYISANSGNRTSNTITIESACTKIYIYGGTSTTTKYAFTATDVQLESGSSVSAYAPYSNICPISGYTQGHLYRTGTNVWDQQWEDGDISITTGQNTSGGSVWRTKNYIPIKPETEYFVWYTGTATPQIRARFYDANKSYIGAFSYSGTNVLANRSFKSPSNAYYMRFAPNSTYISDQQMSINYPSTDTEYHAYSGNTYLMFGKNLLNKNNSVQNYYLSANGTPTSSNDFEYSELIPINTPNVAVSFTTSDSTSRHYRLHGYNDSGTWVQQIDDHQITSAGSYSYSASIPSGVKYIRLSYAKIATNVQIVAGTTAGDYEPYLGTIYGGTLNVLTGELVVNRAILSNIDFSNAIVSASSNGCTQGRVINAISGNDTSRLSDSICDAFKYASSGNYARFAILSGTIYFVLPQELSSSDWKTAIGQINPTIIYYLATPLTYQLTAQQITALIGQNNIWTDTKGNIDIQYWGN